MVIALVFMNMGYQKVESSLFGGVISMINTLLLARSVNQAGDAAIGQNISGGTLVLFKSLITRMALVLTGFYLGIVTFGLDAVSYTHLTLPTKA